MGTDPQAQAGNGTTPAANEAEDLAVLLALRDQQKNSINRVTPSGEAAYYTQYDAVLLFHAAALIKGVCHIGEINVNTPNEVLSARRTIINEEVNTEMFPLLDRIIENGGATLEQKAEMLDHIVDSVYVLLGLAANLGLPFDPAFGIVHAFNMQKLLGPKGPIFREDGKVMKPEGWEPPNAKLFELCLQGYKLAENAKGVRTNNLPDPKGTNDPESTVPGATTTAAGATVLPPETTQAQNQ